MKKEKIEALEMELLLDAVEKSYGYDFKNYIKDYSKRRIAQVLKKFKLSKISELISVILYDEKAFEELAFEFSTPVTEMFRDPSFFKVLRSKILPMLKNRKVIKIWNVGCATGEEVYSVAILLKELGMLEKSKIYATDINIQALDIAESGIYPIKNLKKYTKNYQASGGISSFADYYRAGPYDTVIMDKSLKTTIHYCYHNLTTDKIFCEVDIIFCRNVLIYFDKNLTNQTLKLLAKSLNPTGFLCLGKSENIKFTDSGKSFVEINGEESIFQIKAKESGISGEKPERIFEPMFTTKKPKDGNTDEPIL